MSAEPTYLLDARDLTVTYPRPGTEGVQAVVDVDLRLSPGEIVGLVGETGCGKSSLARALVGAVAPAQGSITFNGVPVTPLGRRARPVPVRRLQMIFQDPYSSLNPRRTIGEQVRDALTMAAANSRATAAEMLEQVGLPASAVNRYPHEFSGGQRQRVAIARALAADPLLIVADEPIASLDASAQAEMANLLIHLVKERQIAMVFVSHDLAVVRQLAQRIDVMYLGHIMESGPTEQVWNSPAHPYTRALISAVPRLSRFGEFPQDLPGDVPDPADPPPGCRFSPRCAQVMDKCRVGPPPPLMVVGEQLKVRCWLSQPSSAATFAELHMPGPADKVIDKEREA